MQFRLISHDRVKLKNCSYTHSPVSAQRCVSSIINNFASDVGGDRLID